MTSHLSEEKKEELMDIHNRDWKILYITPEKITQTNFLNQLRLIHQKHKFGLIAIDEAHCKKKIQKNIKK